MAAVAMCCRRRCKSSFYALLENTKLSWFGLVCLVKAGPELESLMGDLNPSEMMVSFFGDVRDSL